MKVCVIAIALVFSAGCVSARMSEREADSAFRDGRYEDATAKLRHGLETNGGDDGKDSLLYWLDIGLSLHSAGKYDESIQAFLKADKMAEIKDYTSISTEGATLLTSDNIKHYKAEDFENVMISAYLAVDYALVGNLEDALVEARRVNHKLEMMVSEGGRKYKQNAFARYLSATLYEADEDWNNAYVDYKLVRELEPQFSGIGRDLYRLAWLQRMPEDMEEWATEYSLSAEDIAEIKRETGSLRPGKRATEGEIVVVYENGISPVKVPNPQFYSLPVFRPRQNPVSYAQVVVDGGAEGEAHAETRMLHNVEAIAIQNLDEKYGALIAKKIAGVVAKESVAYGVSRATKSEGWGQLARLVMYVSDQADLRSWNLLPHDFQIARIAVKPGTHTVKLQPVGGWRELPEKTVQVKAGEKVFVNFRFMP